MNAVVDRRPAPPVLKDPTLFRDRCYVDGAWVEADSGRRFDVDNPADGSVVGTVPDMGAAETRRAIEAAERALPAWRALPAKERSRILRKWFDLIVANADDLALILTTEQGKPLAEAKGEIVYGASFVEWFAEEAKRVYGDMIPTPHQRPAPHRAQAADRRVRGDHAVELPQRDDHAQDGAGARGGLHHGAQAREQTPFSALALAELAERAGFPKGVFNVVTGDAPADRQGALRQPGRAQDHLHRLHGGRAHPHAPERGHGQEALARAGRQRALHRLRRRRPRRGRRRRDGLQVPQRRPDLRVRQPHLRAGRRLRRVRREARREGEDAQGRQGHGGGREPAGPLIDAQGAREGRGARRRRASPRARRSSSAASATRWAGASSSRRCSRASRRR